MIPVENDPQKRKAILALLSKLALHYWRPDFTLGQAKALFEDYVEDLQEFRLDALQIAFRETRRNSGNFFPQCAIIREQAKIATEQLKYEEAPTDARESAPARDIQFGESRPIRWWQQPRAMWREHWRESEVPLGETASRRA